MVKPGSRARVPSRAGDPGAGLAHSSREHWRGLLAAGLVFAIATFSIYGELWQRGPSTVVPAARLAGSSPQIVALHGAAVSDVIFEAWLVSRHARTLVTEPARLFATEHCAPAENTLRFGIPMITMGVLAIPAYLATGDPILTYNLTLVTLSVLGMLVMYGLVVAWTGVPAAGIVAGLGFAFQTERMDSIVHPSVWDPTWLVVALFFAERLTSRGRWRHAVGLSLAIALQIGASFYTLLGALFAAPPFGIWLLRRDRMRHVSLWQLSFVILASGVAAALLLGPYLGVETESGAMKRSVFWFAPLSSYLPGESLFPGTCLVVLAGIGLLIPRAKLRLRIEGDPRMALVVGVILVVAVAAGSSAREWVAGLGFAKTAEYVPDFYAMFAAVLPGLDAIRIVFRITQGAYVLVVVLAGLGAAALVRSSGRHALLVSVALVAVAYFDVLRVPSLGFERRYEWVYEDVRPDPEALALFEELERQGNRGALLEAPVYGVSHPSQPRRILLSAYHRRRTSACFGSYLPPGRAELSALAERLPQTYAIEALRALGFTTVIWHHEGQGDPMTYPWRHAEDGRPWAARLHGTQNKTAYSLEADARGDVAHSRGSPR